MEESFGYHLLSVEDQREIRADHVRRLEAAHYRLTLEESEEPGCNSERTRLLEEMRRRIENHRSASGPPGEPAGGDDGSESPSVEG